MSTAALPPQTSPTPWRKLLPVALCGLAILAIYQLHPGSTPFISDEPRLISRALEDNAHHGIARIGLTGTLGRPYGPLPIWVYQGLLLLTHDPLMLMSMRIALVAVPTLLALLLIARHTRMTPWPLLIPLASPYTWFYARLLWDNSFNIPLTFLAVAFYVAWLRATQHADADIAGARDTGHRTAKSPRIPGAPYLIASVFFAALTLLVHPMSLPLLLALPAHALLKRRRAFRVHVGAALLALGVVGCVSIPYVRAFFAAHTSLATGKPSAEAWYFALLNPRLLSGAWLDFFFYSTSERPEDTDALVRHASYLQSAGGWTTAFNAAALVSLLAFPLAYLSPLLNCGMGILPMGRGAGTTGSQHTGWKPVPQQSLRPDLTLIATLALLLQIPLLGLTQSYGPPHYYQATLIATALLIWSTLDRLITSPGTQGEVGRRPGEGLPRVLGCSLTALQTASLLTLTLLLAYRTHQTQGTRGLYFGSTMSEQLKVVRQLDAPVAKLKIETAAFKESFNALASLLDHHTDHKAPAKTFTVKYKHPEDPNNAELELRAEDAP